MFNIHITTILSKDNKKYIENLSNSNFHEFDQQQSPFKQDASIEEVRNLNSPNENVLKGHFRRAGRGFSETSKEKYEIKDFNDEIPLEESLSKNEKKSIFNEVQKSSPVKNYSQNSSLEKENKFSEEEDFDFKKSASNLSNFHLKQQISVASQVLNILINLRTISKHYNLGTIPYVNEKELRHNELFRYLDAKNEWINKIYNFYMECPTKLVSRKLKSGYNIVEIDKNSKICVVKRKDKYENLKNGNIRVNGKIFKPDLILFKSKGEYILSIGKLKQNFIVRVCRMWIGYENSLKLYINSHVFVSNTRMSQNLNTPLNEINIDKTKGNKIWKINGSINHPWWRYCDKVIYSHQIGLIKNEKFVNKKYNKNNSKYSTLFASIFTENSLWLNWDYIWPSEISSFEERENLIKGDVAPYKITNYNPMEKYNLDENGFIIINAN